MLNNTKLAGKIYSLSAQYRNKIAALYILYYCIIKYVKIGGLHNIYHIIDFMGQKSRHVLAGSSGSGFLRKLKSPQGADCEGAGFLDSLTRLVAGFSSLMDS